MKKLFATLIEYYDANFTGNGEKRFERIIVTLALTSFIAHVLLIYLNKFLGLFTGSFLQEQNLFSAIITPLTFILFYEVRHLVLSLPKSIILSLKIQFQIASLILIREVFKYLGRIEEPALIYQNPELMQQIVIYLGGSIVCFALVAIFSRIGLEAEGRDRESTHELYISIKKIVSFFLICILTTLAILDGVIALLLLNSGYNVFDYLVVFFYIIIFVDVILFLVSMYFTDDYGIVFMDSAFVIATIFIRLALASQGAFKVGVVIISIFSSLVVLAIYHYIWNKEKRFLT